MKSPKVKSKGKQGFQIQIRQISRFNQWASKRVKMPKRDQNQIE